MILFMYITLLIGVGISHKPYRDHIVHWLYICPIISPGEHAGRDKLVTFIQ